MARKRNDQSAEILDFITRRISQGVPPSVREICAQFGLKSTSSAHRYLKELENKGLIVREQGLNRSIRISSSPMLNVPVLGTVTAGEPIVALEHIEGYIPYRAEGDSGEYFALNVRGDSMINAGIFDGDIVVVRRTPVARNGEIVVALLEDEATVKRFYKEDGYFRLQPENDRLEPIYADEVSVLGRVVALMRNYE